MLMFERKGAQHLFIACMNSELTVVKLFVQYGAKVDNHDKNGKTTLQLAVEKENLATVEYILKCCPDIKNPSNRDSLKVAVYGDGEFRVY